MAILKPLLETGAKPVGSMVIGTVMGDIHDIGKNLVGMMMEGAGFGVDIGINNQSRIICCSKNTNQTYWMSALLTTTMPYIRLIDEMVIKVSETNTLFLWVCTTNEEFGQAGADRYCRDAAEAAEVAVAMVAERQKLKHAI